MNFKPRAFLLGVLSGCFFTIVFLMGLFLGAHPALAAWAGAFTTGTLTIAILWRARSPIQTCGQHKRYGCAQCRGGA